MMNVLKIVEWFFILIFFPLMYKGLRTGKENFLLASTASAVIGAILFVVIERMPC